MIVIKYTLTASIMPLLQIWHYHVNTRSSCAQGATLSKNVVIPEKKKKKKKQQQQQGKG